jgi:hypothetical protein
MAMWFPDGLAHSSQLHFSRVPNLVVLGVMGEYLGRRWKRSLFVIGTLHKHGKEYVLPAEFYRMDTAEQNRSLAQTETVAST